MCTYWFHEPICELILYIVNIGCCWLCVEWVEAIVIPNNKGKGITAFMRRLGRESSLLMIWSYCSILGLTCFLVSWCQDEWEIEWWIFYLMVPLILRTKMERDLKLMSKRRYNTSELLKRSRWCIRYILMNYEQSRYHKSCCVFN